MPARNWLPRSTHERSRGRAHRLSPEEAVAQAPAIDSSGSRRTTSRRSTRSHRGELPADRVEATPARALRSEPGVACPDARDKGGAFLTRTLRSVTRGLSCPRF